jgi:hypothetical protein
MYPHGAGRNPARPQQAADIKEFRHRLKLLPG